MTSVFGNYVRYCVQCRSTDIHVLNSTPMRKNAFEVLMCAQAEKASVVLPSKVQVHNEKDEMFNDILQFVETEGLVWKPSEVDNGTASNFISTRVLPRVDQVVVTHTKKEKTKTWWI